jgi:hypothetical protein
MQQENTSKINKLTNTDPQRIQRMRWIGLVAIATFLHQIYIGLVQYIKVTGVVDCFGGWLSSIRMDF